ncbi:MAG TPA: hypothetical protein DCG75_16230 [Bacteroidales bacterium]|nr:hypothetical protein [Bacteroidales bacterium]
MKRFLAIIFSIFYLALSSSAELTILYCNGEVKTLNVNSHKVSCCCGDSDNSDSCCQTKDLNFKLPVDQQIVASIQVPLNDLVVFTFTSYSINFLPDIHSVTESFNDFNIPIPKSDPLWLINCSLTYYG